MSAKVVFFKHRFRVCEKETVKNVLLKYFLHSFINSKHSLFRCYARYVLVCVKQHKLVQYVVRNLD